MWWNVLYGSDWNNSQEGTENALCPKNKRKLKRCWKIPLFNINKRYTVGVGVLISVFYLYQDEYWCGIKYLVYILFELLTLFVPELLKTESNCLSFF